MIRRAPSLGAVILAASLVAGIASAWAAEDPNSQQALVEREKNLPNDVAGLLPLALVGNADAQNRLGLIYINGKGVPRNLIEGVKWLRRAADKGHPVAELNLGLLYSAGLGVPKDPIEAATWLRRAADQNNPGAQNHLGFAYEHGVGVEQDYALALGWYRKAAAQNDPEAEFNLGIMNERGEGGPKDQAAAVEWLRKSAEHGFALAQIDLANHYLAGEGVTRDARLSYFWAAIGAPHAPENQIATANTMRDRAVQSLSPDEVVRIQNLASQWRPGMSVAALMPSAPPNETAPQSAPHGTVIVRSMGTAFVVTHDGFAITNAHVVPDCKSVTVHEPDGVKHVATVLNRDEHVDLALLKIDHVFAHPATFRDDRSIRQGDDVVVYGFPLNGVLADQGNLTTGMVSALAGIGNDTRLLQISAPVQQGNSGGPVVDISGNVVGVVVSKLNALKIANSTGDMAQNINFAIKENVARDFLEANAVSYVTAKSVRKMETADLADQMKTYTVEVQCDR
ncbi:MAG TPA: trypsin-like peptidase domain-containing protein [Magnetospirillaceae bacterium]|jgi:hypothetical protein